MENIIINEATYEAGTYVFSVDTSTVLNILRVRWDATHHTTQTLRFEFEVLRENVWQSAGACENVGTPLSKTGEPAAEGCAEFGWIPAIQISGVCSRMIVDGTLLTSGVIEWQ